MKAVIMAGGKGTRLRPLTCHLPKPMVPLLGRPCMEYSIDLLKRYGITEIAITLQYLPQVIKNHFGDGSEYGVRLHYFEETSPLGTAGSVKNAEEFLDETFLVISGDALTDFDLNRAIAFHQAKQAIGTLVLTQVDVPLEYGVVMTEQDGRIIRFLEKPSWSEVFSDTVNTGIYVLEPEILKLFERGQEFDFSKDLFPLVMGKNLPLYGYVAEGYWSDIGNLAQYRQTQFDMLDGRVDVKINGNEVFPDVWMEDDVTIQKGVQIVGPAFIGEGTVINERAKIGPYAILGRYNWVEPGADMERSVMWDRNYIGSSASLSGATLCHGVRIGEGATVCEDAVVGEKSWIGDLAVIRPGIKIWPQKAVGASTVQQSSLIWGKSASCRLFGSEGICGIPNLEITPELAGKVASAFGSCLPQGATVSVSCDEHPFSSILKYSVISSLLAIGVCVRDIGTTLAPIARYECRRSNSQGGIHIRKAGTGNEKRVVLQFFDHEGLPIDKGMERKVENAFVQEDFPRPDTKSLGLLETSFQIADPYVWEVLSRADVEAIRNRGFKVVFHCESPQVMSVMHPVLERLGCHVITVFNGGAMLEHVVTDNKADLGIQLDTSGQTFRIYTETGYRLSEAETIVLQTLVALKDQSPMAVPVTAPSIVEEMIEQAGVPIIRTKAVFRSLLEVGKLNPLQVHSDGVYSLVSIMEYIAKSDTTLHAAIERLPKFHMSTNEVACPAEAKGRVMRRLMEEMQGQQLELIDGIKVLTEDGWALIVPDSEKALFKVVAQSSSRRKADELAEEYKNKIALFQSQAN
ncbi:sugar phosphate nucleotidyltransferase [Effusibacillus pohliae]|uniref:sugar phosphate nucleotidyltransferase n=1 Tax=Effusibacillus pohliae TaxID=232270 RepID=UPI000360C5F2|nr:sugar phosphate nucleotidyltransferase [Effusibacillus pohliae]